MVMFQDWCESQHQRIAGHDLKVLTVIPEKLNDAYSNIAAVIPVHYSSPERIANMLETLGKSAASEALRSKLPKAPRSRSGDLGEIIATEFVNTETGYRVPIKRLRWKDHREVAMRGDDVIGIKHLVDNPIMFLKGEVKSRKSISKNIVTEARCTLNKNFGLPSPHALTFVADRLRDIDQQDLANAIDKAQWQLGITPSQVEHLLFTFSQNDPLPLLQNDLNTYEGTFHQNDIGLTIANHQEFITNVYEIAGHGDDS